MSERRFYSKSNQKSFRGQLRKAEFPKVGKPKFEWVLGEGLDFLFGTEVCKMEVEMPVEAKREPKKIRWEIITIETREVPEKPKALITGEVLCIYPTGDVAFKAVHSIHMWNMQKDTFKEVKVPEPYQKAKKIVIRREIIAAMLYIKERVLEAAK